MAGTRPKVHDGEVSRTHDNEGGWLPCPGQTLRLARHPPTAATIGPRTDRLRPTAPALVGLRPVRRTSRDDQEHPAIVQGYRATFSSVTVAARRAPSSRDRIPEGLRGASARSPVVPSGARPRTESPPGCSSQGTELRAAPLAGNYRAQPPGATSSSGRLSDRLQAGWRDGVAATTLGGTGDSRITSLEEGRLGTDRPPGVFGDHLLRGGGDEPTPTETVELTILRRGHPVGLERVQPQVRESSTTLVAHQALRGFIHHAEPPVTVPISYAQHHRPSMQLSPCRSPRNAPPSPTLQFCMTMALRRSPGRSGEAPPVPEALR